MAPSSVAVASAQTKPGRWRFAALVLGSLLIGIFIGHAVTYRWMGHHAPPVFTTQYQAILLNNGAVYYGKLTGFGGRNPMLTDVFYVVSKTDPTTKQVTNLLVKRGKELHGPDRMYLNPNSIVFVEPVGESSKVAQLISEASK